MGPRFVLLSLVFYAVYRWLGKLFQTPAPAEMPYPDYIIWLLGISAGWLVFRLLWIGYDLVRAITASGKAPQQRPILSPWTPISAIAAPCAGYALVVFCWPQAQQGWRQFLAWAAVLPGLFAGLFLDIFCEIRARRIIPRLLAVRLPQFQEQLRSADESERADAAASISCMGRHGAKAVPDLIHALKDKSAEVRAQAALALWQVHVNDPDLPRALHPLLHDRDARVRIAAAGTLAAFGLPVATDAIPILVEGLMLPDEQLAETIAVISLSGLEANAAPAIAGLRTALWDRQPPNIGALDVLDRIGEKALQVLAEALSHPDSLCRQVAAMILGRKGKAAAAAAAGVTRSARRRRRESAPGGRKSDQTNREGLMA